MNAQPRDNNSANAINTQAAPGSSQIVQHGVSEKSLFFLVLAVLMVALVVAILANDSAGDAENMAAMALDKAEIAERESRLAQYELTLIRPALRELGISTEDPETHEE